MEEVDKGCPIIRMGVSGWVFLLVPAYPGSTGPRAVKQLVCVCVYACVCVSKSTTSLGKHHYTAIIKKISWLVSQVIFITGHDKSFLSNSSTEALKRYRVPYPMRSVGGVLISLSRPWARGWINHWSLWRMASATPDLRLPSQPQGIAAPWPVPNYTAWWQRHMCVNNLPKVVSWRCNNRESNMRPLSRKSKSNAVTITPPCHANY